MDHCSTIYHGPHSHLQELFRDRLEFIDGKWTNEFYFYCYADEVSWMRVGYTNILIMPDGRQLDLFISEISTRSRKTLHYEAYRDDRKLFDGESPAAMWSEWMGDARDGVLVSGEITNEEYETEPFQI